MSKRLQKEKFLDLKENNLQIKRVNLEPCAMNVHYAKLKQQQKVKGNT